MNNYPTLYVIQKWISGSRGVEPRTSAPALPCFPLFISPPVPSSRLARSAAYQGYAVTLDLFPLLGFTASQKCTQARWLKCYVLESSL